MISYSNNEINKILKALITAVSSLMNATQNEI